MSNENGHDGQPPLHGSVLWAWVAEEGGEHGVARLQTAWISLGTVNLAGFSEEVLTDPRLVEALQEQANKDGQTVRLMKFVRAEEALVVRPRRFKADVARIADTSSPTSSLPTRSPSSSTGP